MKRRHESGLGRGFWALFAAQFLGAFNDNAFKAALTLAIAFREPGATGPSSTALVALAGGLFLLPFALFSGLAGELADRLEKQRLIRLTKLAECGVLLLGAVALALP